MSYRLATHRGRPPVRNAGELLRPGRAWWHKSPKRPKGTTNEWALDCCIWFWVVTFHLSNQPGTIWFWCIVSQDWNMPITHRKGITSTTGCIKSALDGWCPTFNSSAVIGFGATMPSISWHRCSLRFCSASKNGGQGFPNIHFVIFCLGENVTAHCKLWISLDFRSRRCHAFYWCSLTISCHGIHHWFQPGLPIGSQWESGHQSWP